MWLNQFVKRYRIWVKTVLYREKYFTSQYMHLSIRVYELFIVIIIIIYERETLLASV